MTATDKTGLDLRRLQAPQDSLSLRTPGGELIGYVTPTGEVHTYGTPAEARSLLAQVPVSMLALLMLHNIERADAADRDADTANPRLSYSGDGFQNNDPAAPWNAAREPYQTDYERRMRIRPHGFQPGDEVMNSDYGWGVVEAHEVANLGRPLNDDMWLKVRTVEGVFRMQARTLRHATPDERAARMQGRPNVDDALLGDNADKGQGAMD